MFRANPPRTRSQKAQAAAEVSHLLVSPFAWQPASNNANALPTDHQDENNETVLNPVQSTDKSNIASSGKYQAMMQARLSMISPELWQHQLQHQQHQQQLTPPPVEFATAVVVPTPAVAIGTGAAGEFRVPVPTKPEEKPATSNDSGGQGSSGATIASVRENTKIDKTGGTYETSEYFPVKLHRMVEHFSAHHPDLIHWSEDGSSFVIHTSDPTVLAAALQRWFSHGNMGSLRRQLNLYGWKKHTEEGPPKAYWFHPRFSRSCTFEQMRWTIQAAKRERIKPTKVVVKKEPRSWTASPTHKAALPSPESTKTAIETPQARPHGTTGTDPALNDQAAATAALDLSVSGVNVPDGAIAPEGPTATVPFSFSILQAAPSTPATLLASAEEQFSPLLDDLHADILPSPPPVSSPFLFPPSPVTTTAPLGGEGAAAATTQPFSPLKLARSSSTVLIHTPISKAIQSFGDAMFGTPETDFQFSTSACSEQAQV